MTKRALREKPKRAIVKEELVALTGDFMSAMVLQQFLYWSERVTDFDSFILEERDMAQHAGEAEPNVPLRNGWIYKKAEQLSEETMTYISKSAMLRHIANLVEGGWVEQRRNPKDKMDRTYQYRVNVVRIQRELLQKGYVLEGYRVPLEFVSTQVFDDGQSRGSDSEPRSSKTKLRSSLSELASSKTELPSHETERPSFESEQQYHRLLTEITKEDDDLLRTRAREAQNTPVNQSESQIPGPTASTPPAPPRAPVPSAVLVGNEGLPSSPTLDHVCDAVDRRMSEHLGRWYIAKQGDYQAILSLLADGVPGEFLLSGIDYTFEHFGDKHPNSFVYCSKIIAQLWANEQEKASVPEPMDWTAYKPPAQRRSSRAMRNSMGSVGEKPERDERYTAFYELFPDA